MSGRRLYESLSSSSSGALAGDGDGGPVDPLAAPVPHTIFYLDPAVEQQHRDIAFISSDGQLLKTNKLLFASLSTLDTALSVLEAEQTDTELVLSVEVPSWQLQVVFDFLKTGTIPANLATDCLRAFELLGISLQDKHFIREPLIPVTGNASSLKPKPDVMAVSQDAAVSPVGGSNNVCVNSVAAASAAATAAPKVQKVGPQIIVTTETSKDDSDVMETVIEFEAIEEEVETSATEMPDASKDVDMELENQGLVQIQFPEVCEVCEKGCGTKESLMCHQMNIHGFGKDYKCRFCPQKFQQKEQLTYHQNRHRVYQCSFCTTVFNNQASRNAHESSWHDPAKMAMLPPNKKLQGNLKRRRRRDQPRSDDLSVSCHICGKEFKGRTSPETLKNHIIRVHTSEAEKPFQCHVCNKGFSGRAHLETHLLIHENKKPFKCSSCGAGFNNRGNRNAHERAVHMGMKAGDVKGSRKIGNMQKRMKEETPEERAQRWKQCAINKKTIPQISVGASQAKNQTEASIEYTTEPIFIQENLP